MRRGDPVEVKLGIFVVLDCFAAARNDRFVIIDIYVLRYRYICVEVQVYICVEVQVYICVEVQVYMCCSSLMYNFPQFSN